LDPTFQTASVDATEKESKPRPVAPEKVEPREEPPLREAAVEWTDSSLAMDEEPLWITAAVPSKESSSSALAISLPQETKASPWGGGIQEEEVQVAKGVSPFEGEASFTLPRYLNNPKPIYPQEARQRGLQGEVTLRVEVLASGRVGQIDIRRSSGHESLDRSALATVKKWQFVPAKKGKENIPLWVNIPITFRIQ
jgi:protein TonB